MNKNAIKLGLCLGCVILFTFPVFAGNVNLAVAASLKDVMAELSGDFTKENPNVKFQTNLAGSGVLAKQMAGGAPADLFFSANLEWIDFLKEKKLLDEKRISVLAYNVLVFVGNPDLKVKNLQDLTTLDKIAMGSPKSVPAGDYAMQALKKAGLDTQLAGKLVMAKDVRECLVYAERGEVNGAFVYKTDAEEMAQKVKILFSVPREMHARVTYPMALTTAGSNNPDAIAFYRFLQSVKAQAVLRKHGFITE